MSAVGTGRTRRGSRRPSAAPLAVRDGVAWIVLARPATRNRLDPEMLCALAEAAAAAEDADEARVVVLAAQGPAFSSGLPPGRAWPDADWPDAVGTVAALTKPVIAAVQGEARGWGCALALACDIRVAARDASFILPETAVGQLPGGGAMARLTRIAGVARALEMTLLGTRLSANRAKAWGLVATVVEAPRLRRAATALASTLARRGPIALQLAKEAVTRALDLPLADGIRMEQDLYVLLQTSADRREGIRSFLERRAPRFMGR